MWALARGDAGVWTADAAPAFAAPRTLVHAGSVTALAWRPVRRGVARDADTLVSTGEDGSVRVWAMDAWGL